MTISSNVFSIVVLSLVLAAILVLELPSSFTLTKDTSTSSAVPGRSLLRAGNDYHRFVTTTTTKRSVEERDLKSPTANKKKKTPAPTSMTPTPAPTSLEEEESSSSSSSPSPTPKPHKKDKEKNKHTKVTKETVSPTTMGSGGGDAASTTSTVVSEDEDEEANVTSTVTTPSPTPKPHKKKKDTKKPQKVVSSASPTSSLEAAEEQLIEDEINILETEAYIIDTLLGNITNSTDVFWNDTNAINATTTEYDSYGNSNSPTEVSSTESKAATLQDEIIKNINEEEEEQEEKQAVNTTTNSPTPAPVLSVAPVKPNKGVNSTMDKQNETETITTSKEDLPTDNFTTTTTTTTTPYDDFVEYYEEIIEDYEGSSSTLTNYTSTITKTSTGEYYPYYDDTTKSQSTTAAPTEEEEYDLAKVTRPTSPLDVTTSTTTSTSNEASSAAASFNEADQQQISPAKMKWMTFGMVIAMLFCMIYTAYQVSDNPDGIYASCCRLSVAVVIYVIRGILTPCRAICCRYTLISNSTPDYREPYRGRRGHMELT